MTGHYEESLQRDIDRLRSRLTEMANLTEHALRSCVRALRERNRQIAYSVILRDQRIDELEKELDRLCLEFIVRQQPVAGVLRFAYASIKINSGLERVGDYAESMARQIIVLCGLQFEVPQDKLERMADLAVPMLHDSIRAFIDQDPALAKTTMEVEDQVDVLRHQLNADLVQMRQDNKIPLQALSPLMTIVNRFERVADQAKSICQEVLYMCTGEYTKHVGTEVYRVLFVGEHNACRSLMAEAIGNSLGQPKFLFNSAGLSPAVAVDPTAAAFLAEKGLDVSRHKPRALEQVPHLDHYQLIVALADQARKVFPPPPAKTVCLDWSLPDPSAQPPDARRAAFDQAFTLLGSQIRDLVEAVLGDEND